MFKEIILSTVVLSAALAEQAAHAAKSSQALKLLASLVLPMKEISGLTHILTPDGEIKLVAIGDRQPGVLEQILRKGTKAQFNDFSESLVSRYSLCRNHAFGRCQKIRSLLVDDWEAIVLDASGQAFILQEFSQSIFILDSAFVRIEGRINLDTSNLKYFQGKSAENSGPEGLVLLKNGHILVAKEKNPAVIIEFGPEGDKPLGLNKDSIMGEIDIFPISAEEKALVPLKEWAYTNSKCDISDLTLNKTGQLFALSDSCRMISQFKELDPATTTISTVAFWPLPKEITQPEGLTIDPQGNFFVASDNSNSKQPNVFLLGR